MFLVPRPPQGLRPRLTPSVVLGKTAIKIPYGISVMAIRFPWSLQAFRGSARGPLSKPRALRDCRALARPERRRLDRADDGLLRRLAVGAARDGGRVFAFGHGAHA